MRATTGKARSNRQQLGMAVPRLGMRPCGTNGVVPRTLALRAGATALFSLLLLPLFLPCMPFEEAATAAEHVCTDRACRLLCELSGRQGGCQHGTTEPDSEKPSTGDESMAKVARGDRHGGSDEPAPAVASLDCPRSASGKASMVIDVDVRSILAPAFVTPPRRWNQSSFAMIRPLIPSSYGRPPPTPPPRSAAC